MVRRIATIKNSVRATGLSLILVCGVACGAETDVESTSGSAGDAPAVPVTKGSGSDVPAEAQASASAPAATTAASAAGAQDAQKSQASAAAQDPVSGGQTSQAAMPQDDMDAPSATSSGDPAASGQHAPAMDECGLSTQYPGDELCIKAPDPDKGWQLHIGPDDYDNVDPMYILMPGEERTDSFPAVSSNDKKVFFYSRQFRMRPGAHHNIITASASSDMEAGSGGIAGLARGDIGGHRIGTTNHLVEDNPKDGQIAPENTGVGIPLEPHSNINVSLHSINTTDQPLLREMWVNFWYRPDEEVTEPVLEMFQAGDVSFQIQPHEDTVLGPYNCTIEGDGRMLWFYGHRHANNVRFSAWRNRGSDKTLFYEAYNWEEPLVLEYSSTVTNPMPNRDTMIEGGYSGVLDMKAGDVIEWECHVVNQTDQVLRFTNNTYTGEMCIMDAELVGANCASGFGGF